MFMMAMLTLSAFVLSAIIIAQDRRRASSVSLVVSILFITAWMLGAYGIRAGLAESAVFAKLVFTLGVASITSLVWFGRSLINEESSAKKIHQSWSLVLIVVGYVVCALTLSTDWLVVGMQNQPNGIAVPLYGSGYAVYLVTVVVQFCATLCLLVIGYRSSKGIHRRRILSIFLATGIPTGVAVVSNAFVPMLLGKVWATSVLPYATTFLMAGVTYAMVRNRLFDIRVAAVRSVGYLLALLTMAALYFFLAYIVSIVVFQDADTLAESISPVNVALALILAFAFQPIKRLFDTATDKIFFRQQYDSNEFIRQLGSALLSSTNMNTMLTRALEDIATTLKASSGTIIVSMDGDDITISRRKQQALSEDEQKLIYEASQRQRIRTFLYQNKEASFDDRAVAALMKRRGLSIVSPLTNASGPIGLLLLGEHRGNGYAKRDIDSLETIYNALSIAIQNSKSLEEVRSLNQSLKQRVDEATKELKSSNDQLVAMDATKDEFMSMASHQLRTPLTSVKGYLSMMLDGDAGKLTKEQRTMLTEAYDSSDRMVRLINDFLNVSRIQTGRFTLDPVPVDLSEIVDQETTRLQTMAQSRDIELSYRRPARFPIMQLDGEKIRQVVMNFIDNAIFYSHPGSSVKVRLQIIDNEVLFSVKDHGIGVPKAQQNKLFTRFFRADNARIHRPDGTGVGLYLAKMIVKEHNGKVLFESQPGKGSTFGFRVPITRKTR